MTIQINYETNKITIKPVDPSEKGKLINMGASESIHKSYTLPITMGVITEVYTKFPRLRADKGLIQAGFKLKEKKAKLVDILKDPVQVEGDRLRPYQRADVNFALEVGSCGLFNQPRTGKTPTLLETLNRKKAKKVIIVCPASLIYTWESQVKAWTKLTPYVVESKTSNNLISFPVTGGALIVSKNLLPKIIDELAKTNFDVAVVDEAHFLRNYKTIQSKAVYKLKAKDRIALTGTPSVKHASDIYGILHFLHPKTFTSYWAFCERYFYVGQTEYGKQVYQARKDRATELEQLMFMIGTNRKRKDVMQWLPDKIFSEVIAVMSDKQRKYYDDMKKWFETYDEETDTLVDTENIITQCMRLRQLTLDPRLLGFKEVGCKTKALYDFIESKNEPVIIMSMFTSYLKLIEEELKEKGYKVASIHGQMTGKNKQASADAFQAGNVDVLLCNIISAGTGWTLDRGKTIIFLDSAWNPADNEQAEDRVTPTIKENYHEHNVVQIIAKNSFDAHMFKLLKNKQSLTDIINSGGMKELLRMM